MQKITRTVPMNFNLFLMGDDHEGTRLRYDKGWHKMVDMILSEYKGVSHNIVVDHGDIVEAIMIDDPRYDPVSQKKTNVTQQKKQAVLHRQAIAKNLVVIMEGNHPEKLWRFGNITEEVIDDINHEEGTDIKYGTWECVVRYCLKNGRTLFKHFATHGYGGCNSKLPDPKDRLNSNLRSLKRSLADMMGDCVLMSMGHTHKLLIYDPEPRLFISDTGKGLKTNQHYTTIPHNDTFISPEQRYYVNTGSFYRIYGEGFSGYASKKGYSPIEQGFAIVRVRNGTIQQIDKIVI